VNRKLKAGFMKRNKKLITHLHRRVRGRRQSDDGKGSSMRRPISSQVATPDLTNRKVSASSQPPMPGDTPSRQPLAFKWVDVRFSIPLRTRWPNGITPQGLGPSLRDWVKRTAEQRNLKGV
jgi:hypothetical protein